MSKEQNNQKDDKALHIGGVTHSFDCYLCGGTFNRVGEPCIHYDEDEMDEDGEVSLCDGCAEKTMNKAKEDKIKGLSRRFFNCG
jgi:hypothetical protein